MSLINDALKKAQAQRPSSTTHHPVMQGGPDHIPAKPPRKRRYLFGFVVAVLVVGLFSTLISTYLVYQILGKDAPEKGSVAGNSPVSEVLPPAESAPAPVKAEASSTPQAEQAMVAETQETFAATAAGAPEPSQAEVTPPPTPVPTPEPVVTQPAPLPPPAPAPVQVAAAPGPEAFPEVWNRLQDFEIRGVMSGGGKTPKVLIYDLKTQKSRSYRPGDLIDGALSIKVAVISEGTIDFENHAGARFSKAF